MTTRDNPVHETRTRRSTVIALFRSDQAVQAALNALGAAGFGAEQLAVVTSETRGTHPTVEGLYNILPQPVMAMPPAQQAEAYTGQVNQGDILIRVNAFDDTEEANRASEILHQHGGLEVNIYDAGARSIRGAPAIPPDYIPAGSAVTAVDYRADDE
ncbi:MAG: hypothetical protein DLM69_02470 [Candidatus Chloroheliales bacterium]|nr:MAG: hypothetical protein DLM69_02470 [Chloroflexota bacterium]